jgi:hypothetical protein
MITQTLCLTLFCAGLQTPSPLNPGEAQRDIMSQTEELALAEDCRAMNAEGRIEDLLKEIHKSVELAIKLSDGPPTNENINALSTLRGALHSDVERAQNILKPEWTDSRWPFHIIWVVQLGDYTKGLESLLVRYSEIEDFEVQSVSFAGVERNDLLSDIKIDRERKAVTLDLSQQMSSLDLCQLFETFSIRAKFKYGYQKLKFSKSLDLKIAPGVNAFTPKLELVKEKIKSFHPTIVPDPMPNY